MFYGFSMSPRLLRVRNGALAGLAIAILALGVGLVRALFAILGGQTVDLAGLLPTISWYVAAFVLAGAFAGLVWPRRDSPARRRLVFIVGMAIVVGIIVIVESGAPQTWRAFEWLMWLGLSVAFGLALSYGYEGY
jgi:hypothetical protein